MMCELGKICSDCQYFQEVETDYDIEIRCAKYDNESQIKKEIRGKLEEIQSFIENEIHTVVSPNNWWIYSNLHDEMEQLMIILERNEMI